jgi:xanthine dehydrogenase accessory factor
MADRFVMKKALEEIERGKELAIATIISAKGSTPREVGAKMMVLADGSIHGTIGGGSLEKRVIDLCLEAIDEGKSYSVHLPLDTEGVEMICGGEVDVFIEVYKNKPKLLIAGGGHVGYAIYELATLLDFDIVVFEDREELLTKERFPKAYELVLGNIKDNLKDYPIDDNTYITIVTRGHVYDEECLEVVIGSNAKYIGAMGSKKKVITMMKNLKEKGIAQEQLDKAYAPIGLKLSDETPEEIAVSIISEILLVKNQGELIHMKDTMNRP